MDLAILILLLTLDLFAIFHVVRSDRTGDVKLRWSLAILIVPVMGFITWMFIGPRAGGSQRA